MKRIQLAALSVLALGAALLAGRPVAAGAAPGPAKPQPRWALTWDAALAEAKERNVPIYVTFHQDG